MVFLQSLPKGILNQYFAGLSASFGGLVCASCLGWITPVFNHLLGPDSEIPVTPGQAAWTVAIIELGALVTSLPAGYVINHIGRKKTILLSGPIFIVSWLLIIVFRSPFFLILSRLIQGAAFGIAYTAVPIYLAEISSNSVRGSITSMFYTAFWIGYVIEYVAGAFLSFFDFTYFTLALNIPFIVLVSIQPETPYYYMLVGKEEKAVQVTEWFTNGFSKREKEERIADIKQNTSVTNNKAKITELIATPADRKAFILLNMLAVVRVFSGNGAICAYSTDMFYRTHNLSVDPQIITIANGVVMFIGGLLGSFTTDILGRRPLLLVSCFVSFISQLFTGTYYFLQDKTSIDVSRYSWMAPVFILIYSGISTAGIAPVCSSYTSELFETRNRGLAAGTATITVAVFAFLMTIVYEDIIYTFGLYLNFFLYALCCLVGVIYFYVVAPETKGKSFTEIRNNL